MSHGIIRGPKRGRFRAASHGGAVPFGTTNPMAGVTRDGGSLIYVPATGSEFATALSVAGMGGRSVLSIYGFQEASGNLADSVGSNTLTATGASWLYQQALSGWSRKQITIADGNTNHNFQNTTTAPDISTTSVMLIGYIAMPAAAPAGARRFFRLDTTGALAQISATPRMGIVTQGAGGTTVNGTSDPTNAVRPVVLMIDRTNAKAMLYTNQEKIVGTVGTYTGIALGYGASGGTCPSTGYAYGAVLSGANAEMTDAQVKSLLQTLGWTIPWS